MWKFKVGDFVTIKDGSYAIRLDKDKFNTLGLSKDIFKITRFILERHVTPERKPFHDIIIENTNNGNTYLHTTTFVEHVSDEYKKEFNNQKKYINYIIS